MKQPDQKRIDQYLRDELSPEERTNFESMMDTNITLKREIAAQREAITLAQGMGDARAKETIRRAMEKGQQLENPKKTGRTIAFVLLILLALALSLFYFLPTEEPPVLEPIPAQPIALLYDTNYEPASLTFGNRGSEELLAAASIAYNQKDFEKALPLFMQADSTQTDAKITLAKAICYIELKQYTEAEQLLSTALDDPLSGDKCRWYLALLLLKKEDPQAIQQFEVLAQTSGGYQQAAAQKIVQELKK